MDALNHPDPRSLFSYTRGPNGEILAEDRDEIPASKEEGEKAWRWEMTMRFLRGEDTDFDYSTVDGNEDLDDANEEQERYFDEEEPECRLKHLATVSVRIWYQPKIIAVYGRARLRP
ncbi:hypothetical protein AN4660.2 [Aspergillus nidulans FGSC A4]|nr:hypothetical protein AN4660.2 [Aspergillus nidulans FGSC A4]|eukprot:XP_662264.1 hypothetical protein AN4660.2 [Aspergillus nidulans FGSC A4]